MTPLEGMGVTLDFAPGPVIDKPIRSADDVDALSSFEAEESVPFVLETIRILRGELPSRVPLIGFAGAPFTLFCYLVEGQGSKTFTAAKSFLFSQPEAAGALLDKLAAMTADYLHAQARAGAQALMIFDSWAGLLSPDDYRAFVLPRIAGILRRLRPLGLPLIYFPNQGGSLLPDISDLDVDVVGVDWRTRLSEARRILGPGKAVQGNLDPAALFAPPAELEQRVRKVLEEAGPDPGHIFNLGHGIDRHTEPAQVARLIETVHRETSSRGAA